MRIFYTDLFEIPLPPGHRFPAEKYGLLRRRAVDEGLVEAGDLVIPARASPVDLERVHDPGYLERVVRGELTLNEQRRIGLPWSPELVTRSLRSVGGTLAACRAALEDGLSVYLGGGTHHAFADAGAGFCVFNDAPVALRALQAEGLIERGLIVDCDVHQGDGTAAILADDPSIYTFSIHGKNNFPLRKQRSDLDIALPDGTRDREYLAALREGLETALDEAGADLVVYLAGADPYAGDRYGRMSLSAGGLRLRDAMVLDAFAERELPAAVLMAGGYARSIGETVAVQLATVAEAVSRVRPDAARDVGA
jgi:acetoin utilization deacetylase AcuC-like enzyme